jgi:hypothetical protein
MPPVGWQVKDDIVAPVKKGKAKDSLITRQLPEFFEIWLAKKKEGLNLIRFFGDDTIYWCKNEDIVPFKDNCAKFGVRCPTDLGVKMYPNPNPKS